MIDASSLEFHHQLLDLAEAMKPLSSTVVKLAAAVADPDSTMRDVEAILREDPSLVAALLREANSAASAAASEISTVEGAVIRLGLARVLAIGAASSIGESEARNALPAYSLAEGGLWKHSMVTSYVAEAMYRSTPKTIGAEAVAAALLHDVGKLVLDKVLDPRYFRRGRKYNRVITKAERELADVDHAELSALLLEMWGIPTVIVDAVRYHHEPELATTPMAHVISVANTLAHGFETEIGFTYASYDLLEGREGSVKASLDMLNLKLDVVEQRARTLLEANGILPTAES